MDASLLGSNRRRFSPPCLPLLSLLLLPLLLPSGASARGEAAELGLELDQTPIARQLLLDVETELSVSPSLAPSALAAANAERTPRAAPGDRASSEPAALARAWLAAAPAPTPQIFPAAQGQSGGFWRWIKKHWYVPLLAAAAVGYTVSDDGSDDPSDPED